MSNKMKLLLPLVLCLVLAGMQACKKYHGDSYDFSDKQKSYMNFRDTTKLNFTGAAKNVVISTRTGFTEPLAVVLKVAADNGSSQTMNVTYDAFLTTKSVPVTIPASFFPAGVTTINGTITLVSATGGAYGPLRLGYPAEGQAINIKFTAKQ